MTFHHICVRTDRRSPDLSLQAAQMQKVFAAFRALLQAKSGRPAADGA
jgi:hypothetical protein